MGLCLCMCTLPMCLKTDYPLPNMESFRSLSPTNFTLHFFALPICTLACVSHTHTHTHTREIQATEGFHFQLTPNWSSFVILQLCRNLGNPLEVSWKIIFPERIRFFYSQKIKLASKLFCLKTRQSHSDRKEHHCSLGS